MQHNRFQRAPAEAPPDCCIHQQDSRQRSQNKSIIGLDFATAAWIGQQCLLNGGDANVGRLTRPSPNLRSDVQPHHETEQQ